MQHILQKFSITLLLSCSLSLVAMDNDKQLSQVQDPLIKSIMFNVNTELKKEATLKTVEKRKKLEEQLLRDQEALKQIKEDETQKIKSLQGQLLEINSKIKEKTDRGIKNFDLVNQEAKRVSYAIVMRDFQGKQELESQIETKYQEAINFYYRVRELNHQKNDIIDQLEELGAELPKEKIKEKKKGWIFDYEVEVEKPILKEEKKEEVVSQEIKKEVKQDDVVPSITDLKLEGQPVLVKDQENKPSGNSILYYLTFGLMGKGAAKQEAPKNVELTENKDQNLQEVVQQEEKKEEATLNEVVKNEEEIKIETTEINN